MTIDETRKLISMLIAAFPNFTPGEGTGDMWHMILEDIPAEHGVNAVKTFLSEGREFAPSVGMIRQKAFDLANPTAQMTGEQAWHEVKSNWGQALNAKTVKDDWTNPVIQDALDGVDIYNWGYSDNANEDVFRAHFIKMFNSLNKREVENARMLPGVREVVEAIAERRSIEDKRED